MLWLLSLYNVLSALPRTLEETCWKLTWKASMAVFRVRLQSQNSNDLLVGEEGEQVGCHALLLAAVSHLLRSILPQTPDQDEEIGDKHVCNQCNKIFRSTSALMDHVISHENKKQFKCDLCLKPFSSSSLLQKHTKAVHSAFSSYVCRVGYKSSTPC